MATMRPATMKEALRIMAKLPTKYAALTALGINTGGRIGELLTLTRRDLIDPEKMELRQEIRLIKTKAHKAQPNNAEKIDFLYNRQLRESMTEAELEEQEEKRWQRLERRRPAEYRNFPIIPQLAPYIEKHLNEEARNGHIHDLEYIFRGNIPGQHLQTRSAYATFRRLLGDGYGTHWLRKTYANFMYNIFKDQYHGDYFKAAQEVQRLLGHKTIDSTIKYLALDTMNRKQLILTAYSREIAAAFRKRSRKATEAPAEKTK